ncbi:MAG: MotA/TolQ/ExbB proton channel family protein, partial [Henriciella sp.]|nr:MotA/TolQ/ExbB proton channel family protein [Henriciella sp.]
MNTFTKSLKTIGIAAAFAGASMVASLPAMAQVSLSDILNRVQQDSNEMSQENQTRLREFQTAVDDQERQMDEARGELAQANAVGNRLSAQFDAYQAEIDTLAAELDVQAGDFAQLVGEFRAVVGEVQPLMRESLASFDYPGRFEELSEVAEATTLPTREELDRLPKAILQEMIAQSEVKTFSSPVSMGGSDEAVEDVEVTRVGTFIAATNNDAGFVTIERNGAGDFYLEKLQRQPGGRFRSAFRSLINGQEGSTMTVPFDPNRGELFKIEGDKPSMAERIGQGGTIGYIVIGLLIFGLTVALYKIITLFFMGNAIRSTAKTKQAGDGNPLARVFEAYETNKNADLETLELKLDEQILRESPKIERFNDIVKVLAAVAPLMGLLGTVIGMIITFTAITNFGAGDPKLMAGGISVALMTTVLGLVAAIPLLLTHALAAAMARG